MNMKTLLSTALPLAAFFALALNLHSQEAPTPILPKSPAAILQAMKVKNQELIEKQVQTLQKLDVIEKEAEQIKILAKRT